MNEFIITFRECLEATLIVGIVYTFLAKTNMQKQIKHQGRASLARVLACGGIEAQMNPCVGRAACVGIPRTVGTDESMCWNP